MKNAVEIIKYIGPGLLVTVGFIDPGNWASNVAAGSEFGLKLLWVVTVSTIILVVLQHNAAHLGIATGYCLAEATTIFQPPSDKGKQLKIYYMTQVSERPPKFALFVNQKELFHFSYQRSIENYLRKTFDFTGVPLIFLIREKGDNT